MLTVSDDKVKVFYYGNQNHATYYIPILRQNIFSTNWFFSKPEQHVWHLIPEKRYRTYYV